MVYSVCFRILLGSNEISRSKILAKSTIRQRAYTFTERDYMGHPTAKYFEKMK